MDSISPNLSPVNTQNLSVVRFGDSRKTGPEQENNITVKPDKIDQSSLSPGRLSDFRKNGPGLDNNTPVKPDKTDQLSLSPAAKEMAGKDSARGESTQQSGDAASVSRSGGKETDVNRDKTGGKKTQLDDSDKLTIQKLKLRDLHVKMHEQQHMSAGGAYVRGGPSFEYTTGPDGNHYAVGGEVQIDTSPIRDNPQATIQKAQTIRQAALAPSDPSGADHAVAAKATAMEVEASGELVKKGEDEKGTSTVSTDSKDSDKTNTNHASPYHKQISAYQNSKNFSVGRVVNQLA